MTDAEHRTILDESTRAIRLRMIEHFATPIIAIGIGHDHRQGQCVTWLPDYIKPEQALSLLEQATQMLRAALGK